ncbi:hypothetical protein LOAG_00758 [Loa loa]|uniref:Capsid protein n=1 Tax=Loa loa TaxID=7209 RepID=A0A1I7VWC2_LOALO|nr:hypothetical protein LOAG_00758 [Loa loa]EFO27727.1 hypothetical protein LOAG_00758 [Loa loa]
MPISSTNSIRSNGMLSGKMQQFQMLPVYRTKRFWTEARPLKQDYPDFDDDREGEEYYRNQYRTIIIPNIYNFTVKFTFTTRPTTIRVASRTEKIMIPIIGANNTMQSTVQKPQNVTKKPKGSEVNA